MTSFSTKFRDNSKNKNRRILLLFFLFYYLYIIILSILFIRYIIFTFRIFHKVSTISEEGRGGEGMGGVLHSFYSVSGFYKFICTRPPHFLSASYAPEYSCLQDWPFGSWKPHGPFGNCIFRLRSSFIWYKFLGPFSRGDNCRSGMFDSNLP